MRAAQAQRGYAMVTVLLLAMVAGLVSAVLMDRISTQDLTVRRQIHNYRMHHFERGVREAVSAWIATLYQQPIQKMLGEDGHAFDLELPDGSVAAVYLSDGQGTILAKPEGLTPEQREVGAVMVRELWAITGGKPPEEWFRPVGPLAVSINSAPEELLRAAGRASGDARAGDKLARLLLEQRRGKPELTEQDLTQAITEAGFDNAAKDRVMRLVTFRAELWNAVIDVYPSHGRGGLVARFGGRFLMPGEFNNRSVGSLQSLGSFLTWEEIPMEAERRN
jgi:hypothetical protein